MHKVLENFYVPYMITAANKSENFRSLATGIHFLLAFMWLYTEIFF